MLLVDIELRAVYDIIRPYVRWLDITVPSARQYPLVSAAHRLIRRPSFCLHIPPNALQEPLVIVVDRLRGVNLSVCLVFTHVSCHSLFRRPACCCLYRFTRLSNVVALVFAFQSLRPHSATQTLRMEMVPPWL